MKRGIILFIVFLIVQYGRSQATGYWILPSKCIDGLNYFLFEERGEVMVADENCWDGELVLPTTVNWDGQDYPLRYLASRAFADCKALTRVIIPETVQNILSYFTHFDDRDVMNTPYRSPFYGCTQLKSIEVAENNQWLSSVDGVLYNHDKTQLYNYPPGAERSYYAIPEGVEAIGTAAFRGSINLTSVSIANTVTQIFEEAFYDCENLEQVILPDDISIIRLTTFRGCHKLKSIHLPEGLKEIENAAFLDCPSLKTIVFPENLQTLGYGVFQGCQLETVVIRGHLDDQSIKNLLPYLSESVKLYVLASEMEHYRSMYSGTILSLDEYNESTTLEYFPEGTRWTEIRLDTLKYDSWYSKVGDEWVPNFETIEYRVQGDYIDECYNDKYSCVYTNGPEWTDSLTLLLYDHRIGNNDVGWCGEVTVATFDNSGQLFWPFYGQMYPLSFEVGTQMSCLSIIMAGATTGFLPWAGDEYGTVEEINEGDFGGVRPLKYSDVNGIRFVQGVGVTSWNDGECVFGPLRPYDVLLFMEVEQNKRHYRSMLVHFERDGEVLYDVWPEKPQDNGTGLDQMVNGKLSNGKCYDLSGQRVSNPTKGVYIHNGKKIVIR